MTCCTGKARIYYKEPLHFKLNYSGSANGNVIAPEPLTTSCETDLNLGIYYILSGSHTYTTRRNGFNITNTQTFSRGYYGPLNIEIIYERPFGKTYGYNCRVKEGEPFLFGFYDSFTNGGVTLDDYEINMSSEATKIFKVIGTETGTVYREISRLDECPAVENLGCVMGEENYYDTLLPDQSLGGLVESSCFKKVTDPNNPNCFHVVLETKYKNIADKTAAPPKIRSQLYLCGLPGCPAEYEIECCPDGECDPPKCPPDTDCELDCGSFICCYKNGNVIRTIQK